MAHVKIGVVLPLHLFRGGGAVNRAGHGCLLRSNAGKAALADWGLGADCVHHARMFFDRPDYDLASAAPGTFAITPTAAMAGALENDYANTTAMIFGAAPAFAEILASTKEIERIVNSLDSRR